MSSSKITIMDDIIGRTNYNVNDAVPPSETVLFTSSKGKGSVVIGKCKMLILGTNIEMTLTPVEDVDKVVVNNTFTCQVPGTYILWISWGYSYGKAENPNVHTLSYKKNSDPLVLIGNWYNQASCISFPIDLIVGDTIKFFATAEHKTTFYEGTYCFELMI